MNKQRILAGLLTAMLLPGSLTACAGENTPAETTDTTAAFVESTASAVDENTTTGREGAKDKLPADLKFSGETLRVLYRNEDLYLYWDVVGTDNSGDIIQDAIWLRNQKVEERFGITLEKTPTQAIGYAPVGSELKNLAFSGSDEYDMIISTANTTVTQSIYPYLYELSDVRYLDIEQPWWRTSAIKEMSLDGEHYRYLMGDHTLTDYFRCGVTYYNKALYTDSTSGADADTMYQLVLDGQWTYDKMMELTEQAYADLNGDGTENVGDRFGLMVPADFNSSDHMLISCDITLFSRGDEGRVDLSAIQNERIVMAIDKLIDVSHNTSGVYLSDKTIDDSIHYFTENNSLFYTGRLSSIVGAPMREMENDYGVLPMPKLNEEQENYVTYIHEAATITCVPKSISSSRIDMIGAVAEGWASEAYRMVLTPFIETALKVKYSRDALSGQVIDIIFDNPVISFPTMYAAQMNNIFSTAVVDSVKKGRNIFSSAAAKLLKPAQATLDKYVEEIVRSDG